MAGASGGGGHRCLRASPATGRGREPSGARHGRGDSGESPGEEGDGVGGGWRPGTAMPTPSLSWFPGCASPRGQLLGQQVNRSRSCHTSRKAGAESPAVRTGSRPRSAQLPAPARPREGPWDPTQQGEAGQSVKHLVLGRRALIPQLDGLAGPGFRCSLLEAQPRAGPLHAQRGRRGWDVLGRARSCRGQRRPDGSRPARCLPRAGHAGPLCQAGGAVRRGFSRGSRPQGHSETLTCLAAHPRSPEPEGGLEPWLVPPPPPRPGAERRVRRHQHEPGRGREGASPAGAGGQQGEGAGQGRGGGGGEHAHGRRAGR